MIVCLLDMLTTAFVSDDGSKYTWLLEGLCFFSLIWPVIYRPTLPFHVVLLRGTCLLHLIFCWIIFLENRSKVVFSGMLAAFNNLGSNGFCCEEDEQNLCCQNRIQYNTHSLRKQLQLTSNLSLSLSLSPLP